MRVCECNRSPPTPLPSAQVPLAPVVLDDLGHAVPGSGDHGHAWRVQPLNNYIMRVCEINRCLPPPHPSAQVILVPVVLADLGQR